MLNIKEVIVNSKDEFIALKQAIEEAVNVGIDNCDNDYKGMPELCFKINNVLYNVNYCADIHDDIISILDDAIAEY